MPTYTCAAPIKGTIMRIVKVDTCGVPVTGTGPTGGLCVVTKGFVQVAQEPQYEDGQEFVERTADGTLCVNEKDDPVLKRMQLTIDFCSVDPAAAAYISSARLLDTASPATTGTGFAVTEGTPTNRYSLEVWQKVAGSGACDPSGLPFFIYNAWPNLGATQMGGYTIENGRSTFQVVSETKGAATNWGDGPGAITWLPAGRVVTTIDHWLWNITQITPPTPACGPTTLT
jgi:hypothetical protein